jgi:hypothetical protein
MDVRRRGRVVGPVVPGDHLLGEIDGLQRVTVVIGNPE